MRDKELIQRIKDSVNLVELVGQSVKLRRQGNAWTGLCPFHSEKTPSFSVIPDKGFYHCFGCQKHGDVFTWLMEREGLSFFEAKEQLARAAGIELPKNKISHSTAKEETISRIRSALEAAQSYFQRNLADGGVAQNYLRQRGINDVFAKKAGFGYALDGWENIVNLLRQQGYSSELIEQTGLASRGEKGYLYDFMRNRLTIPIHDARGRLVAFGGRTLGGDQPKYLNTRETQLFKKSEILFGLHWAKGHMRDGALLVEGYFDVLHLHQEGIHQAVAPLGTAVTEEQLKAIARSSSKKVVLCFDGDSAGQKATERALKIALPMGLDVRVLLLKPKEDPDTWCMKLGAEACMEIIRQAPDWASFILERSRDGKDIKKVADRMKIFQTFVEYFAHMQRTPENWSLLQSVATELSIPRHEFNRALSNQAASKKSDDNYVMADADKKKEIDDQVRQLIFLCSRDLYRQEIQQIPVAWWDFLEGAHILQVILDSDGDTTLLPNGILSLLRKLEAGWAKKEDSEISLERLLLNLEKAYVLREIQQTNKLLISSETTSDSELMKHLQERLTQLLSRKASLQKSLHRNNALAD